MFLFIVLYVSHHPTPPPYLLVSFKYPGNEENFPEYKKIIFKVFLKFINQQEILVKS